MPGNGDHDSSSFSEPTPLVKPLSSDRSEHLTASPKTLDRQNSDPEEQDDEFSADVEATPSPLGVKLTGYRLVTVTTVFCFGTIKSILTYKSQSIAPTTLDWVSGTFLTLGLYWIGLYEDSNKWKWFFHVDFAPAIGYCAKRVVGEFIWLLFCIGSWPIFTSLYYLLLSLCHRILICYFKFPPRSPYAAVAFILNAVCLPVLWIVIRRIARRVIDRGLERALGFVHIYGPGVPPGEDCDGRFGAVGQIVLPIFRSFFPLGLLFVALNSDPSHC